MQNILRYEKYFENLRVNCFIARSLKWCDISGCSYESIFPFMEYFFLNNIVFPLVSLSLAESWWWLCWCWEREVSRSTPRDPYYRGFIGQNQIFVVVLSQNDFKSPPSQFYVIYYMFSEIIHSSQSWNWCQSSSSDIIHYQV